MSAGVLSVFEAEHLVKNLKPLSLEEVGSEKWLAQHDVLEKLNIQAHQNAITKHDEFVVDAFVSCNRVPVLVHELLVVEAWRERVFPKLKAEFSSLTSVKAYVVLYHEATISNLLEVLLYHESAVEAVGDALTELVDYCNRKINALNAGTLNEDEEESDDDSDDDDDDQKRQARKTKQILEETTEQSLTKQCREITFSTAVIAVTLLRFITQHISTAVPVSIVARLLDTHDIVLSLVPLVEHPPWTRKREGKLEKFIDQKWTVVAHDERLRLTSLEGQVWLAIYNLILDNTCRTRYQYNTHRKGVIIRLKRFFTPVLLDQLPMLRDLQRVVEELQVMEPPPPTASSLAIIEQVPELRNSIVDGVDFEALAKKQLASVFANDEEARRKDIARLAQTYNLDNLEDVIDEPKCSVCGKPAEQRCSRCQLEWYCGRKCQVKAWKGHKKVCDLIVEDKKKYGDKQDPALDVAKLLQQANI